MKMIPRAIRRSNRTARALLVSLAAVIALTQAVVLVDPVAAAPSLPSPAAYDDGFTPRSARMAGTATAHSRTGPTSRALLVVMDISGSMNDPDANGVMKIEGAKEAVLNLIGTVPEQTLMGLNTYPGSGNCHEGMSAIPLAQSSRSAMDRYVRQLKADGGTPTAEALLKAGQDIQSSGVQEGVVVLVSDGHSNCGDPCVAAEQLAAQGIDITVNTVGFQINEAGRTELQCIADATSGSYFDAEDPDELADSIAASTVPELTMDLDPIEQVVTMVPGYDNTVTIKGTVTNTGLVDASNVEAVISYDTQFSPGSAQPRMRLGNLQSGESIPVEWTFRPLDEFSDATVSFEVRAFTRGFETNPMKGSVYLRGMDTTDEVPAWLSDVRHIVVLGDSYSSGEGAGYADPDLGPAFDHPTDEPYNSCHRSNQHNTGGQLADLLGGTAKVTTLACSGAVTLDYHADSSVTFLNANRNPEMYHRSDGTAGGQPLPAQKQALRALGEPVDLILMTMGGNDLEFAEMVSGCIVKALRLPLPSRADCKRTSADRLPQRVSIERRLPIIYKDVHRTLDDIDPSNQTPILVLAYPVPFPVDDSAPCQYRPDFRPESLDADIHFPLADRRRLNRMVLELNASVKASVFEARSEGAPVWFVEDTATTYLGGRTYCDKDPWINRATVRGALYALGSVSLDYISDLDILRPLPDWIRPDRRIGTIPRFLRDRVARWGWMNQAHPTRDGYRAMASQVLTWSIKNPQLADEVRSLAPSTYEATSVTMVHTPIDLAAGSTVELSPGDAVTVEATGFSPGSRVDLVLHSVPEHMGHAVADESGKISTVVWLRPDVPLGDHHLVAEGVDPDGNPLEVRRPIEVERPLPGWWWPAAGAAGATAVGTFGTAATWWWLRRRERRVETGSASAVTAHHGVPI